MAILSLMHNLQLLNSIHVSRICECQKLRAFGKNTLEPLTGGTRSSHLARNVGVGPGYRVKCMVDFYMPMYQGSQWPQYTGTFFTEKSAFYRTNVLLTNLR